VSDQQRRQGIHPLPVAFVDQRRTEVPWCPMDSFSPRAAASSGQGLVGKAVTDLPLLVDDQGCGGVGDGQFPPATLALEVVVDAARTCRPCPVPGSPRAVRMFPPDAVRCPSSTRWPPAPRGRLSSSRSGQPVAELPHHLGRERPTGSSLRSLRGCPPGPGQKSSGSPGQRLAGAGQALGSS